MGKRGRSTIRTARNEPLVMALVATPPLGLAGAAFILSADPLAGSALSVLCCAVGVGAIAGAFLFTRRMSLPHAPLRVRITGQAITLHQRGRRKAKFWRSDIELILLEQERIGQSCSLSVYGHARIILDAWQTSRVTKPAQVLGLLERHSYPHAFRYSAGR